MKTLFPLRVNIKTRILVFVLLFEIIAYTTIQLFNNYLYIQQMAEFKQSEIAGIFQASANKIDSASQLMERNVTDLAIGSENLYRMLNNGVLNKDGLTEQIRLFLEQNFSSFTQAIGGGVWFEPYVIDKTEKYYGPYVFRQNNSVTFTWELSSPEYDYLNQDWYNLARANNWGKAQDRFRPLFWTAPYWDQAGTRTLMMTADCVMLDDQNNPIGMTTVDWSLAELTKFLSSVKVTDNALPFFVHKNSGLILSYPLNPDVVMSEVGVLPWGRALKESNLIGQLTQLENIDIDGQPYKVFFVNTENGFVFGSLVPESDINKEINSVSSLVLLSGMAVGLLFILVMFQVLKWLFHPFDAVLHTIQHSISYDEHDHQKVELHQVNYDKQNEFTPIIKALNDVYFQIKQYVQQIEQTNRQLRESQNEVNQLNLALELKVQKRTQELEAKTQEVTESLNRLQRTQQQLIQNEKHASLGRLVAGVAHQINTPLGICVTAASYLSTEIDAAFKQAMAGRLTKSGFSDAHQRIMESATMLSMNLDRASDLITSFKQVAVDQSIENKREFDVSDYVQKIMLSLRSRIEQSPHDVTLECEPHIMMYSHPGALTQILTNVLDNALIHAFDDGKPGQVRIQVSATDKELQLVVADNGKGMSEEVRNLVFDPFFTTQQDKLGSGLGLHLVYNIVLQQLGGSIECQSQQGVGTKFIVRAPLKPATRHA